MQLQDANTLINTANQWAALKMPFVIIINYEATKGVIIKTQDIANHNIACSFRGSAFGNITQTSNDEIKITPQPLSYDLYRERFDIVHNNILTGNTYLLNLTFATYMGMNIDLRELYNRAQSPYKLYFDNDFVCYSPEPFVRICGNKIYSFPMKGTARDTHDNVQKELLENRKELFEHYTIVDLIRNDLAMVSTGINIEQFRYIERIETVRGALLQTSSKISGTLPEQWQLSLGDIIFRMLPAGSISGAPKLKTMEIIRQAELTERGFYTGIMGYFDGENFDSCVLIRFLRKDKDRKCYYHSGGGITSMSDATQEYNELIEKIYVPTI